MTKAEKVRLITAVETELSAAAQRIQEKWLNPLMSIMEGEPKLTEQIEVALNTSAFRSIREDGVAHDIGDYMIMKTLYENMVTSLEPQPQA